MKRRQKAGWAKLLIAALLLQYIPLLHGGLSVARAAGVANGTNTVLQNTYGPATQITDYTWKRVTTNLSPDARQGASMVFDEMAENVVMFGGQDNSKFFDETWIWHGKEKLGRNC